MRCKHCNKFIWPWTLRHLICEEKAAVRIFREAKTNGERARGVAEFLRVRGLSEKHIRFSDKQEQ